MKHEINSNFEIVLDQDDSNKVEPKEEVVYLEAILNRFWDSALRGTMIICPARVVGVQFVEEYRIDVQPLQMKEWGDEVVEAYPTISNVPYVGVGTDDCGVLFSPKQGQTVLLMFSQASLDEFKGGSIAPYNPLSKRMFDLDDAIAMPSIFPFNRSPNRKVRHYTDHSTEDLTVVNNLGTKKENKVLLKKNGSIEVRSSSTVRINAPNSIFEGDVLVKGNAHFGKDVKVDGTVDVAKDVVINGKSVLKFMTAHTHAGVQGGNSNTAPPNPM